MKLPSKMLIKEITDKIQTLESKLNTKLKSVSQPSRSLKYMKKLAALKNQLRTTKAQIKFYKSKEIQLRRALKTYEAFQEKLVIFEKNVISNYFENLPKNISNDINYPDIDLSELDTLKQQLLEFRTKVDDIKSQTGVKIQKVGGNIAISSEEQNRLFEIGASVVNDKLQIFPINNDCLLYDACEDFNKTGDLNKLSSQITEYSKGHINQNSIP